MAIPIETPEDYSQCHKFNSRQTTIANAPTSLNNEIPFSLTMCQFILQLYTVYRDHCAPIGHSKIKRQAQDPKTKSPVSASCSCSCWIGIGLQLREIADNLQVKFGHTNASLIYK
jgi:hypothetical protein